MNPDDKSVECCMCNNFFPWRELVSFNGRKGPYLCGACTAGAAAALNGRSLLDLRECFHGGVTEIPLRELLRFLRRGATLGDLLLYLSGPSVFEKGLLQQIEEEKKNLRSWLSLRRQHDPSIRTVRRNVAYLQRQLEEFQERMRTRHPYDLWSPRPTPINSGEPSDGVTPTLPTDQSPTSDSEETPG